MQDAQLLLYEECAALPLINKSRVFGVNPEIDWQPVDGYPEMQITYIYAKPVK